MNNPKNPNNPDLDETEDEISPYTCPSGVGLYIGLNGVIPILPADKPEPEPPEDEIEQPGP